MSENIYDTTGARVSPTLIDRPIQHKAQIDKEWNDLLHQCRNKALGLGQDGKPVTGSEIPYPKPPSKNLLMLEGLVFPVSFFGL